MCPIYNEEKGLASELTESQESLRLERSGTDREGSGNPLRISLSTSSLPLAGSYASKLHFSPSTAKENEEGFSLNSAAQPWRQTAASRAKDSRGSRDIPCRHSTGSLSADLATIVNTSSLKLIQGNQPENTNTSMHLSPRTSKGGRGKAGVVKSRSPLQLEAQLAMTPVEQFQKAYERVLNGCRPVSDFVDSSKSFNDRFNVEGIVPQPADHSVCILRPYPHQIHTESDTTRFTKNLSRIEAPCLQFHDTKWNPHHGSAVHRLCFHPSAIFTGIQKSNNKEYNVTVEIVHVSLKDSFACGYLNIRGLTAEYPSLTTYFEAEILGSRYSFDTKKWDADVEIDLKHWKQFHAFDNYEAKFLSGDSMAINPMTSRYIFMRWKEQFLVPDHHVTSINGASYDGFYYICLDLATQEIHGYYYYHNAKEWFEALILKYNPVSVHGAYRLS